MAGNREVILADFQACTGIEDVGEAILHLESTNWDLLAAVNRVMHYDSQQLPSETSPDIETMEVVQGVPVITISPTPHITPPSMPKLDNTEKPGTSRNSTSVGPARQLEFHIHYMNRSFTIKLVESSTVGDLKQAIFVETTVGPCQQVLQGWRKDPPSDSTILRTLELPKEVTLYMTQSTEPGDSSTDSLSDRLTLNYTLNVHDETAKKVYRLNFLGSRTILDVKANVYALIDVPVRNQVWHGWPSTVKDDKIMLAQSGITYPEHDLTVGKLPPKPTNNKDVLVDLADSDSSADGPEDADEFEDAPESFIIEDDMFIDNVPSTKIQRLMPENVEDETMGTLHFAEEFEKRYGRAHPDFFAGTFEEAIKESCLKPAKDRKLLAVYLHHDNSVLANVFCTQLLGFETVLQLLSANFIVWGWDVTYESNKAKFLASAMRALGVVGASAVQNMDIDTLPVLMIIMRSRSITEIFTIVHGNVGVNELLTNLIQAVDVFQEQRRADIGIEEERHARERVKQEQDRAYQESLAVDRAKEEAKLMHEQLEKQKKEEAESQRLADATRKESHRLAVESSLPPEPELGDQVLKIKIRLTAGKFLERRFQADTPLQTLLNFLIVQGYPTEEYKVLSSWPRRDLTSMDTKLTLAELKFCPQETVILEQR